MTDILSLDGFPDARPGKPLWLVTLADLALLLVGFLVLVQATTLDKAALAAGIRAGFDVERKVAAMPVGAAAIGPFDPGSAVLPQSPDTLARWVRDVTGDRRVRLEVAGFVDGSAGDVDPVIRSGALLAADRARVVAGALIQAGAIDPARITIVNAKANGGRRVLVSIAYSGDSK